MTMPRACLSHDMSFAHASIAACVALLPAQHYCLRTTAACAAELELREEGERA